MYFCLCDPSFQVIHRRIGISQSQKLLFDFLKVMLNKLIDILQTYLILISHMLFIILIFNIRFYI